MTQRSLDFIAEMKNIQSKSLKRPLANVEFTSFDELNGNTLMDGDRVTLPFSGGAITAIVTKDGLNTQGANLFTDYEILPETTALKAYGYPGKLDDKGFPQPEPGDYEALTRMCLLLYAAAYGLTIELKMPNRKWKLIGPDDLKILRTR